MKLSEAIRIGAKLRPQGHGKFFSNGRSCAIGAAMEACGCAPESKKEDNLEVLIQLGILMSDRSHYTDLFWRISAMNDSLEYTRERISDILEAEGL